jgi:hypothetical protein
MEMKNIIKGLVKGLVSAGEIKIAEKVILNAYISESEKCVEELQECK